LFVSSRGIIACACIFLLPRTGHSEEAVVPCRETLTRTMAEIVCVVKAEPFSHRVPVKKKYKCHVCHRSFNLAQTLIQHSRKHTQSLDQKHSCKVCGLTFRRTCNWLFHEKEHERRRNQDREEDESDEEDTGERGKPGGNIAGKHCKGMLHTNSVSPNL